MREKAFAAGPLCLRLAPSTTGSSLRSAGGPPPPLARGRQMRTLGLIVGTSWEATRLYYDLMNRIARDRLGGQHSAALILWSVDFAPIVRMQETGRWDEATAVMVHAG